ncbi:MAG: MFS transporter [Thermicanus sp.]|nr:MFS transporter [Thermicanus sp.]
MDKTVFSLLPFRGMYFFTFFAFGAFMPLLTVYLQWRGLSGAEIGILTALGPVVILLLQPVWGMLADRYQIQKPLLYLAVGMEILVALLFPQAQSFLLITMMMFFLHLFQAPIIPFTDSLTLQYIEGKKIAYGNLRLWGSIGFAVAVYVTGRIMEHAPPSVIFYLFAGSMVALWFTLLPIPAKKENRQIRLFSGIGQLLRMPHFLLFLLSAFFVFGPMNANNFYFGLYYLDIGGTVAGIGLVFLLSAGSEVPFLRMGGWLIARIGLENTLLLASLISLLRWVLFLFLRDPMAILSLFFLQGFSIGLYLAAAPQYVRRNSLANLQVTALTLYAAFGNGLGTMATNLVSGWILDRFSPLHIYIFFIGMTLLGFLSLIAVKGLSGTTKTAKSYH